MIFRSDSYEQIFVGHWILYYQLILRLTMFFFVK